MKKKLSEMTLLDLANICHRQDSCIYCPLYCHRNEGCKVAHLTPAISLIHYGEEEISYDLSSANVPVRETITQAVREEFFEDR